jgi:hypothetical protein
MRGYSGRGLSSQIVVTGVSQRSQVVVTSIGNQMYEKSRMSTSGVFQASRKYAKR